jgi:5'-3' exoribonuclease 1
LVRVSAFSDHHVDQTAFPQFFNGLEQKSRTDLYEETDFYHKDQAAGKMAQIKDWLKAEGVRDLDSVALDNDSLTKECIMQIEAAVDDLLRSKQGQAPHFVTVKNVPRHAVLKPSHAVDVLKDQKFRLGDRVIYVQDSGNVPFANRGTVVGISEDLLDVVFDRTFITGISLGGRWV